LKLFISWSGQQSHQIASFFRDWLPYIFSNIEPFVSAEDISKGARWSDDIAQKLYEADFGLICITKQNMHSPWLNFEAGALSKSITDKTNSKVCPFLMGIKPEELIGPLQQFQAVQYDKADIKHFIFSLNKCMENPIPEKRLSDMFENWWPKLYEQLEQVYQLISQKIIWCYESTQIDTALEQQQIADSGLQVQSHWYINTEPAPIEQDGDIYIYVFEKTSGSVQNLEKIIQLLRSFPKSIPLVIYTRYASGDKSLSAQELELSQQYPKTKIANFSDTLISRLKEIV
jgi:hypothetical protein